MTENQKLREALRELMIIVSIHQSATRNNFAWAEMAFAREALALPTAEQVDDINVAESLTSVTKTAAPVGERLTLSAEDVHAAFVKHFPKTRISQAWIGFAAEIANAVAARAALSAGDEVDAQRYRWLRDESWAGYNQCKGFPHVFTVDGAGNRRTMLAEEALDAAIDAAMRKESECPYA